MKMYRVRPGRRDGSFNVIEKDTEAGTERIVSSHVTESGAYVAADVMRQKRDRATCGEEVN